MMTSGWFFQPPSLPSRAPPISLRAAPNDDLGVVLRDDVRVKGLPGAAAVLKLLVADGAAKV